MAGLGCGAFFLYLGKGRNDWLYIHTFRVWLLRTLCVRCSRRHGQLHILIGEGPRLSRFKTSTSPTTFTKYCGGLNLALPS